MIYNRLDIIPLKLFLEVYQTENLTLLTDEVDSFLNIKETWLKMKKDYEDLGLSGKTNKLINLIGRIQSLKVKYDYIGFSVKSLNFDPDDVDMMAGLNGIGYKINRKTYLEDLDRISRESQSLLLKVKRLEQKLPKKETKNTTTIDKVILGYCAITGLNFDTNKITVIQFHSLKELAEEKIKQMEALKTKE